MTRSRPLRRRPAAFLALAPLLAACTVEYASLPLPAAFFQEGAVDELRPPERRAVLGLEVALNEADDLASLDLQPGVRVVAVVPDGPADLAGVRVGDVLLEVDGVTVDDPGRLESVLDSIREERLVKLLLQRGARVFETEAVPEVVTVETGRTVAWVERALLRVAVADDGPGPGDPRGIHPVVVGLGPDSPLADAGVRVGERIVAFQGRDAGSAAEFVRRIRLALEPADPFTLDVLDGAGATRTVEGWAWDPGRRVVAVRLWPVFGWRTTPTEDRDLFWVGDLVLLDLFRYERIGGEASWSVLGLLHWETGEAVLEEEPVLEVPLGGGGEAHP